MSRYVHDAEHPARLNKKGRREPTRQPRYANRLYCLVWADHDLFKLGLGSGGGSARSASAGNPSLDTSVVKPSRLEPWWNGGPSCPS